MKYVIILTVVAIAGYFLYLRHATRAKSADQAREIYVCDKCNETFCECHKEET